MTAHAEIMKLLNRYCRAIDTAKFDAFLDLYEKATWTTPGAPIFKGREEIKKQIIERIILYEDGTPRTKHVMTNVDLDINEADGTAQGQRYITIFQATEKLPIQAIFSAHYFDAFVKDDGDWRFQSTRMEYALMGDMSHHIRLDENGGEHVTAD